MLILSVDGVFYTTHSMCKCAVLWIAFICSVLTFTTVLAFPRALLLLVGKQVSLCSHVLQTTNSRPLASDGFIYTFSWQAVLANVLFYSLLLRLCCRPSSRAGYASPMLMFVLCHHSPIISVNAKSQVWFCERKWKREACSWLKVVVFFGHQVSIDGLHTCSWISYRWAIALVIHTL